MAYKTPGSEAVRDQIIHHALRLFAEKGYAATSVREIATSAYTTKPMIYYYFGSKERLYLAIVQDQFTQLAQVLESAVARAQSLEASVRSFTTNYFRFFFTRGRATGLLYKEMFGLGESHMAEISQTYFTRVKGLLTQILLRHKPTPEFSAEQAEASALAVLGILNMFLLRRLFGGQRFAIRPVIQQVLRVYLRGLQAASGQPAAIPALVEEAAAGRG